MQTTCAQALKNWEAANGTAAEEADYIKLYCQVPPIVKMDSSLNALRNCERLALSTNAIDRIIPLAGMSSLKILSLGRNQIKKIEKLDDVASTLEELWVSYNQINSLDGVNVLTNLAVLYISNNLIKNWAELDKLAGLPNLRDVLFVGNPIYDDMSREQARIEVLKRIPQVAKIDGDMVKPAERELAAGTAEA
ncbi:LC1 [Symbiodinium microadriaticum]|nr:LC1 [Symbiodinium microadriaticum]